jgi:hypothetical protein
MIFRFLYVISSRLLLGDDNFSTHAGHTEAILQII